MNWTKAFGGESATASAADRTDSVARVLAVGNASAWAAQRGRLSTDGNVHFADFHEVTNDLLVHLCPRLVLSPLLARNFDCVDLAQRLGQLGYRGPYRAIDIGLPDPALIVREVRSLVPGLDFEVVPFV